MKKFIYIGLISLSLNINISNADEMMRLSQGGLDWIQPSQKMSWSQANSFCNSLVENNIKGWMLSPKEELVALYASGKPKESGWILGNIWSSSTYSTYKSKDNVTPINYSRGSGGAYHYYIDLTDGQISQGERKILVACIHPIDIMAWNSKHTKVQGEPSPVTTLRPENKPEQYQKSLNTNLKVPDGGGYVPDGSSYSPSTYITSRHESYEERDKRILEESYQYQRNEALKVPTEQRVHQLNGTVSNLPDCLENEPRTDCYAEVINADYMYRGDWKYGEPNGFGITNIYSGENKGMAVMAFINRGIPYGHILVFDTNAQVVVKSGNVQNGQFTPDAPVNTGPSLLERFGNWGRAYQQYEQQSRPVQVPPSNTAPTIAAPPAALNIYDQNGNLSGRIDNGGGFNSQGSVYDNNGNYIGKVR